MLSRRGPTLVVMCAVALLLIVLWIAITPPDAGFPVPRRTTELLPTAALTRSSTPVLARSQAVEPATTSPALPAARTTGVPPSLLATHSLATGHLVFAAWHSPPRADDCSTSIGIYMLTGGSTQAAYLTNGCDPLIAPDAQHVAFMRLGQLYVIGVDGHGETQLTKSSSGVAGIVWSPDGQSLAYGDYGGGEIYTIAVKGGKPVQLSTFRHSRSLSRPAWSPDGQQLAVTALPIGVDDGDVYLIDIAGRQPTHIARGMWPVWSPNGRYLAYNLSPTSAEGIAIVQRDGTVVTQLPRGADPVWSPDSERIAFTVRQGDHDDLSVMQRDGMQLRRLTQLISGHILNPAVWSPDGTELAFTLTSQIDETLPQLYTLRLDEPSTAPTELLHGVLWNSVTWTAK
ncbi:MAG: PD40 domain-containing protein [Herpetosiphonaceae bacterium]|nr:PD40 domain-containing protein [Herpetosiphonaceae bacterium]